jgi:hypothetical protein
MTLFALTTTGNFYKKENAEKLEKLGFEFKKLDGEFEDDCFCTKKSRTAGLEINTLEELLSFAKEHGDIIISFDEDMPHIEIYDDYRE